MSTRMQAPAKQNQPESEALASSRQPQLLQRRTASETIPEGIPPIVHEVLQSPGQPLDSVTRPYMESRFGQDFSGVRVHTDGKAAESARAVNANAYTVRQDIVFNKGRYAPETIAGKQLLGHELTHTAQQMRNGGLSSSPRGTEHEADQAAARVVAGETATVQLAATGMQCQVDPDELRRKIAVAKEQLTRESNPELEQQVAAWEGQLQQTVHVPQALPAAKPKPVPLRQKVAAAKEQLTQESNPELEQQVAESEGQLQQTVHVPQALPAAESKPVPLRQKVEIEQGEIEQSVTYEEIEKFSGNLYYSYNKDELDMLSVMLRNTPADTIKNRLKLSNRTYVLLCRSLAVSPRTAKHFVAPPSDLEPAIREALKLKPNDPITPAQLDRLAWDYSNSLTPDDFRRRYPQFDSSKQNVLANFFDDSGRGNARRPQEESVVYGQLPSGEVVQAKESEFERRELESRIHGVHANTGVGAVMGTVAFGIAKARGKSDKEATVDMALAGATGDVIEAGVLFAPAYGSFRSLETPRERASITPPEAHIAEGANPPITPRRLTQGANPPITPTTHRITQGYTKAIENVAGPSVYERLPIFRQIVPTQPLREGTLIPRSFEITTNDGSRYWVNGSATEHFSEALKGYREYYSGTGRGTTSPEARILPTGQERRPQALRQTGDRVQPHEIARGSTTQIFSSETGNVEEYFSNQGPSGTTAFASAMVLENFEHAVSVASRQVSQPDFNQWGQRIEVEGWEFIFQPPAQPWQLPVITHANPRGILGLPSGRPARSR